MPTIHARHTATALTVVKGVVVHEIVLQLRRRLLEVVPVLLCGKLRLLAALPPELCPRHQRLRGVAHDQASEEDDHQLRRQLVNAVRLASRVERALLLLAEQLQVVLDEGWRTSPITHAPRP